MKKFFAIALAAALSCGLFAGCGETPAADGGNESTPASGSASAGSAVEAIKERGELVMYTNAAFRRLNICLMKPANRSAWTWISPRRLRTSSAWNWW